MDIYLMAVLSYLYGIIMYNVINVPGHVKIVGDAPNDTDKRYLS